MESTANLTSNSKPNAGDAIAAAHKSIDNASEVVHPAVDRLASGAHNAVDSLAGAAESIGSKGERFLSRQNQKLEGPRAYVRENPLMTVGIAVAAGWLVARLFGVFSSR
jgi:ElaB/YqjD/DUF883 family membrane-anchored ribosome-binding protein